MSHVPGIMTRVRMRGEAVTGHVLAGPRRSLARLLVIVAVVALSVWAIYPPGEKVKLGLDLAGGVHLVLRVEAEDAVRLETQAAADRLRHALTQAGVAFSGLTVTNATEFRVDGVQDDERLRGAVEDTAPGFDRTTSGSTQTLRMQPTVATSLREETVELSLQTIERRVNALGATEPVVARYGRVDRILVELPGVTDVVRAKQIIKATAQLRLTLVVRGPLASAEAIRASYGNALPGDVEILPGRADGAGEAGPVYYAVRTPAVVTGRDVRNVQASVDEYNRPAVAFTLTQEAAERFGAFTGEHVGRTLATVLDGRVTSIATIVSRIDDRGQIAGLSREEMLDQVITLKSGALPADLSYVEERTVSATLGEAAIRSGVSASVAGLALVVLFMLVYYRKTGLNALVSIVLNLLLQLGLVALLSVTLTLPGIAGLILTIGMGVDSNVLIFERIREERAAARSARAAVRAGFDRVWVTIVDTHVTALISAAILYQFGTGPLQGFALMLTIGLMANVFTAVFVSKTVFEVMLSREVGAQGLSI